MKPGETRPEVPAQPPRRLDCPRWTYLVPASSWSRSFFNARAVFKLSLDWKGMLTTCRFVARRLRRASATLPTEDALEREPGAPVFLHLVPAYHEPDIAGDA